MASPFYKYIFPGNLLGQDSGAEGLLQLYHLLQYVYALPTTAEVSARPILPPERTDAQRMVPPGSYRPDV